MSKLKPSNSPLEDYLAILRLRDETMNDIHNAMLTVEIPPELAVILLPLLQNWHIEKRLYNQLFKTMLGGRDNE